MSCGKSPKSPHLWSVSSEAVGTVKQRVWWPLSEEPCDAHCRSPRMEK